jgi:hypothetical protein
MKLLIAQLTGVGAVMAWCLITGFVLFAILKATLGLRISQTEEMEGLDIGEHGTSAYPDFSPASPLATPNLSASAVVEPKPASVPATDRM